MAEGGVSVRGSRRINQAQADGDEMSMIDVQFGRLKMTIDFAIGQQWDRLLILNCLFENYRCTIAVKILEQVHNLLINVMLAEFESHASLFQRTEDRYPLRIELGKEMNHLTTVKTLGTNYLQEVVNASISTEIVVARVAHYLLEMEATRDRLSGTMQAMTVLRR